jgi:hypothetical protein
MCYIETSRNECLAPFAVPTSESAFRGCVDAWRRIATQDLHRFRFLGFASEAVACRRFATAGPGPSYCRATASALFQLALSCEATTGISLGCESEVTVPHHTSCEATTGDTEPDELRSQLEQGFRFSVVAGSASEQTDRATPLRKSRRKVCNSVKVPSHPARGRRWPTGRMRGLPAVSAV